MVAFANKWKRCDYPMNDFVKFSKNWRFFHWQIYIEMLRGCLAYRYFIQTMLTHG